MSNTANRCYLVIEPNLDIYRAKFYDANDHVVGTIPLEQLDNAWKNHIEKARKISDLRRRRPIKVVISDRYPKRGRCAYFHDSAGYIIEWYPYNGPADLKSVVNVGDFDRDWMLTNNIPVIDEIEKSAVCAIM